MITVTTSEAKKIVKTAMEKHDVEYVKLRARTVGFGGETRVCVKPVGMALPDPRAKDIKEELKGTGVIFDIPSIVAPGYIVE